MHIYICASYEIYICRCLCAKLAFGFGLVSLFVPTMPNIRKRVYFLYLCIHTNVCWYIHYWIILSYSIKYIYYCVYIHRYYIYLYIYTRAVFSGIVCLYVHTCGHVLLLSLYAISTFIFGLSCDCLSRSLKHPPCRPLRNSSVHIAGVLSQQLEKRDTINKEIRKQELKVQCKHLRCDQPSVK